VRRPLTLDPYELIARLARLVAGDSRSGDIRLFTILVVLGIVSVVLVPPDRPGVAASLALVVAVSVTALQWRRNPLLGVVLAAPFAAILASAGAVLPAVAGPGLLLAATADHASARARRRLIWLAAFGAAMGIEMLSDLDLPGSRGDVQALVLSCVLWTAALYVGTGQRRRREAAEALRASLEQERRLATSEERTRVARDLHDSIGHAVNVIAIQAGAGRLQLDRDPERSRSALEAIESTAREAANELDGLVGTLRGDQPSPTTPPPGLDGIAQLIDSYRAAGLDVTVVERNADGRPDGAAIGSTAYRILQEALTNSVRHGGSRPVTVAIAHGPDAVTIEVANELSEEPPEDRGGHGVTGMGERAALIGGSLQTAVDRGRFVLQAHLPYRTEP
jgi:signal transduction histidine kinase